MTELILASTSPIRRQLLDAVAVAVRAVRHGVDEESLVATLNRSKADPRLTAKTLARAKAEDVSARHAGAIVIGADQTLDFEGETWGKPADRKAAARQLEALSGRSHRLHSSFALVRDGRLLAQATRSAALTVRNLSAAEIAAYLDVAGAAALASVGAYQIEGFGLRLFERVAGDYFTILGLPMLPLLAALRRLGILDP